MPGFGGMIDRFAYGMYGLGGGIDAGIRGARTMGRGARGAAGFVRQHPYRSAGLAFGAAGAVGAVNRSVGARGLRGRSSGASPAGLPAAQRVAGRGRMY